MPKCFVIFLALLVTFRRLTPCAAVGDDFTVPAINVHFEHSAKDVGRQMDAAKALIAFKARARRVQQNIDSDIEVLEEFASLAGTKMSEASFLKRQNVNA